MGGFTLIELMIVIFIIGILGALAAYSFSGIRKRVRRTSCRENQRIIFQAASLCQIENPQLTGANLSITKLFQMTYLKKVPVCPSGGSYAITLETEKLRVTCFKTTDGFDHGFYE